MGAFSSPLADSSISKSCGAAFCREGGHGATSSWAHDSSGRADRRRQKAEDGPFFHDEHFDSSWKKDDKKKRARGFSRGLHKKLAVEMCSCVASSALSGVARGCVRGRARRVFKRLRLKKKK